MKDAGPGFAVIHADDSPAVIDRKMKMAFSPVRALRWALSRNYRRRDPKTGRFLPKAPA